MAAGLDFGPTFSELVSAFHSLVPTRLSEKGKITRMTEFGRRVLFMSEKLERTCKGVKHETELVMGCHIVVSCEKVITGTFVLEAGIQSFLLLDIYGFIVIVQIQQNMIGNNPAIA